MKSKRTVAPDNKSIKNAGMMLLLFLNSILVLHPAHAQNLKNALSISYGQNFLVADAVDRGDIISLKYEREINEVIYLGGLVEYNSTSAKPVPIPPPFPDFCDKINLAFLLGLIDILQLENDILDISPYLGLGVAFVMNDIEQNRGVDQLLGDEKFAMYFGTDVTIKISDRLGFLTGLRYDRVTFGDSEIVTIENENVAEDLGVAESLQWGFGFNYRF